MKKLMFFFIISVLAFPAFSQNYRSIDNNTGNWEDASTWIKSSTWLPDIPSTDGGSNSSAYIYGYVTRNGNLTVRNGSVLTIYDTLWVKGNLTVNQQVRVVSGGLLIVDGNLIIDNGGRFNNDGISIIQGAYSISGGGRLANDENFYSFEGGTISNGGSNSAGSEPLKNSSDLESEFPALFDQLANGVLPIKLLSFAGMAFENHVQLNWITAWEENFDYFIVERAG
ncbi:MAG: hypothetical protein ACLFT3_12065, partial [Cyclobacteriaceae bacterium]